MTTTPRPANIPTHYTSPMINADFDALLEQLANLESLPLDALDRITETIKNNFNIDLDNDLDDDMIES